MTRIPLTIAAVLLCASALHAQAEIRKNKRGWADLGCRLQTADNGAMIAGLDPDGPAAKAGLKKGVVMSSFNG